MKQHFFINALFTLSLDVLIFSSHSVVGECIEPDSNEFSDSDLKPRSTYWNNFQQQLAMEQS